VVDLSPLRLLRAHLFVRVTSGMLLLAALAQPGMPRAQAKSPRAPQGHCSLVVSNTNDTGVGSLRFAVACATAGQTVTFDPLLVGATISLSTGEIAITQALSIDGSAAMGVIVDAGGHSRIFNISTSDPVTVTALVLQRGS